MSGSQPGELRCQLESLTTQAVGSESWQDCGVLELGVTADAIATAKQCATAAQNSERAFRLIWSERGTDSNVRGALLGMHAKRGYLVVYFRYDSAGDDPDGARSQWSECTGLALQSDCSESAPLCASCGMQNLVDIACRCVVSDDEARATMTCG